MNQRLTRCLTLLGKLNSAQMARLDSTKLSTPQYMSAATLAGMPAAGRPRGDAGETARGALAWEQRPPTPPQIKQGGYQHYARQNPGAAPKHFAAAQGPPHAGPFGRKTRAGVESAADCLKSLPDSEVGRWRQERAEDVYLRCGASIWYMRTYTAPAPLQRARPAAPARPCCMHVRLRSPHHAHAASEGPAYFP